MPYIVQHLELLVEGQDIGFKIVSPLFSIVFGQAQHRLSNVGHIVHIVGSQVVDMKSLKGSTTISWSLEWFDIGPALVVPANLRHCLPNRTPVVDVGRQILSLWILIRHASYQPASSAVFGVGQLLVCMPVWRHNKSLRALGWSWFADSKLRKYCTGSICHYVNWVK
jgi:hypothetical protein